MTGAGCNLERRHIESTIVDVTNGRSFVEHPPDAFLVPLLGELRDGSKHKNVLVDCLQPDGGYPGPSRNASRYTRLCRAASKGSVAHSSSSMTQSTGYLTDSRIRGMLTFPRPSAVIG